MKALIFIDKWLSTLLEWILVTLFFGFFSMVCILVVLRYGLGDTIIGGNEGVTVAFVFTVAIGAALAISRREHIAITYFIDLLPIPLKKAVYILGLLLIAFINVVMINYSIEWITLTGAAPWHPFRFPQGYFQMAIPIGCGLATFFCFVKIILTLAGRETVDTVWMPED
jgi:TRAP-type C4-dicarboxylate transport system permease small subunit